MLFFIQLREIFSFEKCQLKFKEYNNLFTQKKGGALYAFNGGGGGVYE